MENVTPLISVNSAGRHQTAPTIAVDANGRVAAERAPGTEGLLLYDVPPAEDAFGARGRRTYSDLLTGRNG